MKRVVLTFDDGFKSHIEYVVPLLKRYDFNATFFICLRLVGSKTWEHGHFIHYMPYEEIVQLNNDGFEIGNHFRKHVNLSRRAYDVIIEGTKQTEQMFESLGIQKPVSFCPPGFNYKQHTIDAINSLNYKYMRGGCWGCYPEKDISWQTYGGHGDAYKPGELIVPCSVIGTRYGVQDAINDINNTPDDQVRVICLHNFVKQDIIRFTDWRHDQFEMLLQYMNDHGYRGIALRDL